MDGLSQVFVLLQNWAFVGPLEGVQMSGLRQGRRTLWGEVKQRFGFLELLAAITDSSIHRSIHAGGWLAGWLAGWLVWLAGLAGWLRGQTWH